MRNCTPPLSLTCVCQVIIMGATNRPQDLDSAILRRMPTRFHINQPVHTHVHIIHIFTEHTGLCLCASCIWCVHVCAECEAEATDTQTHPGERERKFTQTHTQMDQSELIQVISRSFTVTVYWSLIGFSSAVCLSAGWSVCWSLGRCQRNRWLLRKWSQRDVSWCCAAVCAWLCPHAER